MSTNTALDGIKARVEGHTEGPWEIRTDHGEPPAVWHDSEAAFPIGRCADCGVEAVYTPADAELFAAAPKLLAALEAVLSHASAEVKDYNERGGRMTEYDQLEAAGRAGYAEELAQRIQDALS